MTTSSLAQQLREARHVVFFTGAGASAESGIPTYRDALMGRWSASILLNLPPAMHSEQIQHCVGDGIHS